MTAVPPMFFTADIASLLKIPEWRVVKFATGREYELAACMTSKVSVRSRWH